MSATSAAMAAGFAHGFAIGVTISGSVIAAGATLIEGAALKGVQLLANSHETASKIARVALVAIAIAAACTVTGGVCLATFCAVALFTNSEVITFIAVAVMAKMTLSAHYSAFQCD